MHRLFFLHGFLGSKEDWDEVISHLPYECIALDYPFVFPPDSIIVGYSMGGRIALQAKAKKRIIISAHPGLIEESEKKKRLEQDLRWIEMLKEKTLDEFLSAWYAQSLFDSLRQHPNFFQIRARRLLQNPALLIDMLEKYSLAHQTFQIPEETHFIYGEEDLKYAEIYSRYLLQATKVERSGHVIPLENPEGCAAKIRELVS